MKPVAVCGSETWAVPEIGVGTRQKIKKDIWASGRARGM